MNISKYKIESHIITVKINGGSFKAECAIDDILINPKLPPRFGNTSNECRPASHQKFWNLPYIETFKCDSPEAVEGKVFQVRCLDGGAWDRPTMWGGFYTLKEAIECANAGPAWRKAK